MVQQVGDFSSGDAGDILAWDQHRIGMLICYELIFPSLSRAAVRNGADLFVNITNDGWFGFTAGPIQHAAMARLRAAGAPIVGHIEGRKPGHGLNNRLLHALFSRPTAWAWEQLDCSGRVTGHSRLAA